jgi:selenocysteine lyase/cysteine desulfurase
VRISLCHYNSLSEVSALLSAVAKLTQKAGHATQ